MDTESARVTAGDRLVTADVDGTTIGLTICYDLRFPELYRALALAGAGILTVPANFTERTGRDHWEVLLRARAIENGAFVLAPSQIGGPPGQPAYGRSMVSGTLRRPQDDFGTHRRALLGRARAGHHPEGFSFGLAHTQRRRGMSSHAPDATLARIKKSTPFGA